MAVKASARHRDRRFPLTDSAAIDFSLVPLADRDGLEGAWLELERRARPSLFQSWSWIGSWLAAIPDDVGLYLLTGRIEGAVCALAVFSSATRHRHGWLRSDGLFLNEAGRPDLDALTIEYNGILADEALAPDATLQALRFLVTDPPAGPGWDEIYLSGVDEALADKVAAAGLLPHLLADKPCDYVDLEAVRASGKGYLEGRSKNSRYQIRRALRRYEDRGALTLSVPSTLKEALEVFAELKALHQSYWTGRGETGSFANPFFEEFHRLFIERRFAAGEVELLRASAGDETIGCLYNFRYGGRVYGYQSGFAYEEDPALKPGLVSHYLAIERNLADGAAVYDFMAGFGQHKRSLGTDRRQMVWLSGQRPRVKYRLERALRCAKNLLKGATGAAGKQGTD